MTMTCQFCSRDYPGPSSKDDCCPGCAEHGACEDCGEKSAGSAINVWRCDECAAKWLDNYEPPEPDLSGPTRRELDAFDLMREKF